MAAHGGWSDDRTFVLTFDTIDRIEAGTATFSVDGDDVTVTVQERTQFPDPFLIAGRLATDG